MFCQLGCAGIHVSRRLHAQWWQRCFATPSEWNRWQRRHNRLSQLQGRIKFPPPTSITVEGVTHNLPMRSVGPPERHPTREELEYFVGFFDGDGCVTMRRGDGRIQLQIGQNIDSAHVLLHYRERLGGGIGRQASGTGKKKAMLQWHVSGSKMRHVAALLGQIPSMKQAQMKIAGGGNIEGPRRERTGEQLFQLKQKDHVAKNLKCTWAYFSGFFDAEGSVTVTSLAVGIELNVRQNNPFVLKRLLEFLHDCRLDKWWLRHDGKSAQLVSTDLATSKQTLKHLLDHGLLVKQKQARLALSLNAANHQQVREAVMNLNGWQNKYNRLDEAGLSRAKELQFLQRKSSRSTCLKEQELLQDTIQVLREEHVFQKLVSKCHLMRKDIRKMLSEGAFVTPPWCQSLLKFRSIMLQLCQSALSGFVSIRCWLRIRFQTMKSGWSRSPSNQKWAFQQSTFLPNPSRPSKVENFSTCLGRVVVKGYIQINIPALSSARFLQSLQGDWKIAPPTTNQGLGYGNEHPPISTDNLKTSMESLGQFLEKKVVGICLWLLHRI